jgi:flagellin-specific chaperone FliS
MKQTAVSWLVSQLNKQGFAQVVTDEEIEQAKEMEKEQIERLIKEHDKMYEIMQALSFALSIDGKKDLANKTLLETANTAIDWKRTNF